MHCPTTFSRPFSDAMMPIATAFRMLAFLVLAFMLPLGAAAQLPCSLPARLDMKVLLEGPLDSVAGLMSDALRQQGLVPLNEPYTALGYAYRGGGGGESIDASVLLNTGEDAIVDWVVVEVRAAGDPGRLIFSRAGLLQRDGDVADVDGVQDIGLCVEPGNYHIAVRHRNHLGIMSAVPVSFFSGQFGLIFADPLDLSSPGVRAYQEGQSRKQVGARMAMWSGDVNFDGRVQYTGPDNDRDMILQSIGGSVPTNVQVDVYTQPDVNLDSRVKYVGQGNDRDPILQSIGGSVPTNIREGYIPNDSLTLRPNVHVIDNLPLSLDTARSDIDSNTVMVYAINGAIPAIEIGHVVVGTDPLGGYLRLVSSASATSDSLYLTTEQAGLADVFASGKLMLELVDNGGGQQQSFMSSSTYFASQVPIPFNGASFINVRIEDLSVVASSTPVLELDFGASGLMTGEVGLKDISIGVSYKLRIEGSIGVDSLELPVVKNFGIYKSFVIVSGIPILYDVVLNLSVLGKIEFQGAVNTITDVSNMLQADATSIYTAAGGWSDNTTVQFSPPTITTEVSSATLGVRASVGLAPEIMLKLYKAPGGLYGSLGPEMSANLRASTGVGDSQLGDYDLSLTGKIKGKLGVKAKVLDRFKFDRAWVWESDPFVSFNTPYRLDTNQVSGNHQIALPEDSLPLPLRVHLDSRLAYRVPLTSSGDTSYHAAPFVPVNFEVVSGSGTLSSERVITDLDGNAETHWTLGPEPVWQQRVRAWVMNGVGDTIPMSFHFEADTAVLRLEYVSGNEQIGEPDSTLADTLVVRVLDQEDMAVPNVPVRFVVTAGNGQVSDTFVATDTLGFAKVTFTLGNDSTEQNTVLAYLLNNLGDTLPNGTFLFKAYIDPDTMFYAPLSGNFQTGSANTVLPVDLRVQINSVLGQVPQEDVLVFFEVVSGGGSVSSFGTSTNSDGIASVAWTLGPDLTIRQKVKAWALDVYGDTIRGGPLEFEACTIICPPTATDIDGNVYNVVKIGCDCWFQQNLRTTHFKNGDPIAQFSTSTIYIADNEDNEPGDNPAFYSGMIEYQGTAMPHDGPVYNENTVVDARGLCPQGWHVSTFVEWSNMALLAGVPPNEISICSIGGDPFTGTGPTVDLLGALKLPSAWPGDTSATNLTGLSLTPGPVINYFGGNVCGFEFVDGSPNSYRLSFDTVDGPCSVYSTSEGPYTGIFALPCAIWITPSGGAVFEFHPGGSRTSYCRCVMD